MKLKRTLLVFLCSGLCHAALAQTGPRRGSDLAPAIDGDIDPEYITDLYDRFTVRLYGSNKFTRYGVGRLTFSADDDLFYKSNSHYNAGVGFNYRSLAVNLGFRAPFVNNDTLERGKTKFFDLQAYVYARKANINFYAQTYTGYYLANSDRLIQPTAAAYRFRPDLRTRNLGFSIERILNPSRYSFRAAYLQNEYQQRSAGTFLVGGGAHFLRVTADSAIVPRPLGSEVYAADASPLAQGFRQSSAAAAWLQGGYAHTLVISKHLFLMGQLMTGVGGSYTWLTDDTPSPDEELSGASYHLNLTTRAGLGYQGNDWFAGLYFVTAWQHYPTPIAGAWQQYETGTVRLAIARHFELSAKTAEQLNRYEPGFLRRR